MELVFSVKVAEVDPGFWWKSRPDLEIQKFWSEGSPNKVSKILFCHNTYVACALFWNTEERFTDKTALSKVGKQGWCRQQTQQQGFLLTMTIHKVGTAFIWLFCSLKQRNLKSKHEIPPVNNSAHLAVDSGAQNIWSQVMCLKKLRKALKMSCEFTQLCDGPQETWTPCTTSQQPPTDSIILLGFWIVQSS